MDSVERFWSKVDRDGPVHPNLGTACWIWKAGRDSWGYGGCSLAGKQMGSHRAAWILTCGPIPEGMFVLHRCDVRACVNPEHLFLGTHRQNMSDMAIKGRAASGERNWRRRNRGNLVGPRGEDHGGARLREEHVREIRARWERGGISQRELASAYGISFQQINRILTGKRWSHVA